MKTYKANCKNCGLQEHFVSNQSRKHGVKLTCVLCGRENKYWHNFKSLQEVKK